MHSIGSQRSARMRITVLRRDTRKSGFYRRVLCPWTRVKEVYKRQGRTTETIPWSVNPGWWLGVRQFFQYRRFQRESIWSRKARKVARCRTSRFNYERSKMVADVDYIHHFCYKLEIIQGWGFRTRRSMGGPIWSTPEVSLLSTLELWNNRGRGGEEKMKRRNKGASASTWGNREM